jgi:hypothetical protein
VRLKRRSREQRAEARRRRRVQKVLRVYNTPTSIEGIDDPDPSDARWLIAQQNGHFASIISDYLVVKRRESDWPRIIERVDAALSDAANERAAAGIRDVPPL